MQKKPLEIELYPSPLLRKKCRKVENIDSQTRQILDDMLMLMRKHRGVGLAANQAGLNLSLIVMEADDKIYKLINPKITKKNGKTKFNEGCLSFPGLELYVPRAEEVWLSYTDEEGKDLEVKIDGVLAIILQHEIDHINGVMFIDRISFLKRLKIGKKLRKIKRLYKQRLKTKT